MAPAHQALRLVPGGIASSRSTFSERGTDQIERLGGFTVQTCSRRARTRALPELHHANAGLEVLFWDQQARPRLA
jgi:hypothetical protein